MSQHPFTDEQLSTGRFSGGRIEDPFAEGWAMFAFRGNKGHWWSQMKHLPPDAPRIGKWGRIDYYLSACGMVGQSWYAVRPFSLGDTPACKRCLRRAAAAPSAADRRTFVGGPA